MTNEEKLKQLKGKYSALQKAGPGTSAIDLAKAEHEMWDLVKLIEGKGANIGERRNWFVDSFGGMGSHYEVRALVYSAGEWAHVLFDQVDKKLMAYSKLRLCVHRAKQLGREHAVAPGKALVAIIAQHDGTSLSIETAKVVAPKMTVEKKKKGTLTSKDFVRVMVQSAKEFAEAAAAGYEVEAWDMERISEEFEVAVSRAVTDMLQEVSVSKQKAKRDSIERIGLLRYAEATEVLGISTPFRKRLPLRTLNKRYKERAAGLKGMVDRGNQKAADELVRVNQAYEILKKYVKQMELGNGSKKN